MMTLPFNLTYLYENNRLGVQFIEEGPLQVIDEDDNVVLEIETYQAYPVIYLSLQHGIGIMLIDDENSMAFEFDTDSLEFVDIGSDTVN